jgi:diguanylate cyclase (GGDEF)-like protein
MTQQPLTTRSTSAAAPAIGSPIYRATLHRPLWVLVLAWTVVAVTFSLCVTAALISAVWGSVGWMDLAVAAAVTAIVTPPIAYRIGKLMRELNASRSALERLARVDSLTGIANRSDFFERAGALMQARDVPPLPLAALMIDVDRFKTINDEFGHMAGDGVLCDIARVLSLQLRDGDLLARYGGEEFAALLPRTDAAQAMAIAERLRQSVESDAVAGLSAGRPITISVGVACAANVLDIDRLLSAADRALYRAKGEGRNRCRLQDLTDSTAALHRSAIAHS